MLHIHNGDASADKAAQSSLPGEQFAFREALVDGPAPRGLSENEWRQTRAEHLAESYDMPQERLERELLAQEQKLSTVNHHDESVLWFEHDLFCQVHLVYLLDWFARYEVQPGNLSLICIGEFSGRPKFRGLGELTSDELASLFPMRKPVTADQFELATAAWSAYSAGTPTQIEALLENETKILPFLDPALRAHLRRFPSTTNGLGLVESTALRLVQNGPQTFVDLFAQFGEEHPVYGFGDAQFWLALKRLIEARQPVIQLKGVSSGLAMTAEIMPGAEFQITELGKAVSEAGEDYVTLNGIDLWLGGVHLEGDHAAWRWDESSGKLVAF